MKKKSTLILVILGAIVLVLVAFVLFSKINKPKSATSENVLTAGVLLPLSGPAAGFGGDIQKGMMLAYSELSPEIQNKFKIIYQDNKLDAKDTVTAFRALDYTNKLDSLFVVATNEFMPIAPNVEQEKLPTLAFSYESSAFTNAKYGYRFIAKAQEGASKLEGYIAEKGYKKVAIVANQCLGCQMMEQALKDKLGDRVSSVDEVAIGMSDFKAINTKLISQKPDAVINLLISGFVGEYAKQLRNQGGQMPMLSWDMAEDVSEVKASGGALEGVVYVTLVDVPSSYTEKFFAKYSEGSASNSSVGYDYVAVLAGAVEKGITTRDGLQNYLQNLSGFSGAMGTYSHTADMNGFTIQPNLRVIKGNQFLDL
ncbi:MAG: ABC transporter substrate-binding protein [Candidatus Falkowbacteria bacterium]